MPTSLRYLIIFFSTLLYSQPGWYVRVYVKNVASHFLANLHPSYPLTLVGILPHEHKMSVVNLILKRSKNSSESQPIPAKQRLVFHCGYRRYAACPIFSQHTAASKHKVTPNFFLFHNIIILSILFLRAIV